MKTSSQIRHIAASLGGNNYVRLVKVAQSLDNNPFNIEKATRVAPQYWSNLGLEKHKDEIKKELNTTAEPNTPEFLKAVYKYQKANPQTGTADGILGPKTLTVMSENNKSILLTSIQSRPTTNLQGKDLKEQVEQLGLVSLEGTATIKNNPYAHPKLKQLLEQLNSAKASINRVTEAFPPTSSHQSTTHANGRAMDFTLNNPDQAQAVVNYINKIPGFKAVNEYANQTGLSTGSHIHVQMTDAGELIASKIWKARCVIGEILKTDEKIIARHRIRECVGEK